MGNNTLSNRQNMAENGTEQWNMWQSMSCIGGGRNFGTRFVLSEVSANKMHGKKVDELRAASVAVETLTN